MAGTLQLWGAGSGLTNVSSMIDAYLIYDELKVTGYEDKKTVVANKKKAWEDLKSSVEKLNTIITDLSGVGKTNYKTATLSSENGLKVSVDTSASNISYEMTVKQLATSHTVAANKVSNIKESLNTVGEFKINGATINIEDGDSLSDLVNKINNATTDDGAKAGVRAYVVDGAMFLESTLTGTDNTLKFEDTDGILKNLGIIKNDDSVNTIREATNAIVNINGVDVERASNTIKDAIDGVELTLTEATNKPITVKVEENKEDIKALVKNLVDTLNEVTTKANKYTAYTEGGTSGILNGDTSVASLKNLLTQTAQKGVNTGGELTHLFSIGVSIDKYGKFNIDESVLDKQLEKDSGAVLSFLTGGLDKVTTKPGDAGAGILVNLKETINQLIGGTSNLFSTKLNSFDNQTKNYEKLISKQKTYIETRRAMLEKQFAAMETIMNSYNSQLSYFTSLNNSNSSK